MKKFKEFLKKLDRQSITVSAALFVIGILFIAFPESSLKIVCYVLGAATIIWGIVKLALCFRQGSSAHVYDMVFSGVIVAAGILLLVAPGFIASIVTVMLGIILIVDSILKLQECLALYRLKNKSWWLGAVVAGICAVLGIITICNPFGTTRVLMVFVGVSMIFDALCGFGATCWSAIAKDRVENAEDDTEGEKEGEDHSDKSNGNGNIIDI